MPFRILILRSVSGFDVITELFILPPQYNLANFIVLVPEGKTKSADDFLTDIIDLNHDQAIKAFKEMVFHKRNPDLNEFQVLQSYRQIGLTETANYLHALL